ncbi:MULTISPECIES: ATPase, T2SS/T4P/T4SS family [Caldimonas]|uniref:GspE/PulE family protein n=1 Tax=Caldimonas TaxID=196013 RepID=UPI00037E2BF1|nr:ATPase, T2SS/T4P/T4SS family [Caldimonas manganoxidans]
MSDTRPLPLLQTDAPALPEREKFRRPAYRWPTPAYAAYPSAQEQLQPIDCIIEGLNLKQIHGRLIFFVPEEQVLHVQVPPARTTMALRFHQFRALHLKQPVEAHPSAALTQMEGLLDTRPQTPYVVRMKDGPDLQGVTIGHVETDFGLFLFPPIDDQGTVQRLFIPRHAYSRVELGPRIGEVLVQQRAATTQDIELAVREQATLRERKIGDILMSKRIVSPDQLKAAIEQQSRMPVMRIGEALVSMGLVTQEQIDEALAEQAKDRSVPLGELLVRMQLVSRKDLQAALARKMGYPLVDVDHYPVSTDALSKVPYAVAERLEVLPLMLWDSRLIVAMEDPSRHSVIEELEFVSQLKVVPTLGASVNLSLAIKSAYEKVGADVWSSQAHLPTIEFQPDSANLLVESLERDLNAQPAADLEEKPIEQSDNSLVRLINTMIVEAYQQGASDIHIECYPGREKVKVRFRKDGLLQPYLELPHTYRNAMVARIKIMCDLDISERRKPQDGKINFARFMPGHRIELRVATIPTNNNLEDVVMRILASAKPIPLDQLGLAADNLQRLQQAMERPHGLVLCVGPTGSGKTTTLHSALSYINVPERKIWTAEDPVEITQPGLRQVQINPKIDWTFAKALRAFLRADPDVIMVGEIRDQETAQMAIEASLTGHLVLSTLHTNSAPETVTRLLDMGMDPFNFADSLLAVLAQRLVRRLCTECRTSRPATAEEVDELLADYLHVDPGHEAHSRRESLLKEWIERYGRDGRLMHHESPGCDKCNRTGYRGRAGLHELMIISRELRHLIQTNARADQLQQRALQEGMRTLRQDGILKVLAGVTTLAEVRATSST